MKKIDLSIIIVNYNTKDYIKECLYSIFSNTDDARIEVIVVDNNSHDNSVEMIKKEFSQVKLIANSDNVGFGQANNQGVRTSEGRYLLLLNPDTKILPKSLNILYQFMETHPKVGIAAPMLLNDDLSLQRSCRAFPGLWREFSKALGFFTYMPSHPLFGSSTASRWDHDKIQAVDQPQGACLMIRRDVLEDKDIFDRRFYMYYEEVDLCYRIKKKNWQIYFVPDAKIIHYAGKSFSKNMPRMIYHLYKSKFLFYKKHYNIFKQSMLYFLTLLEMVYRITIFSLIGLIYIERKKEVSLRRQGYLRVLLSFSLGRLPNR